MSGASRLFRSPAGLDGTSSEDCETDSEEESQSVENSGGCFAKALLSVLDHRGSDFLLYRDYLEAFTGSDPDARFLGLSSRPYLTDQLAEHFFKLGSPSTEPQLFSFFSSSCLTRLSRLLDAELVVYRSVGRQLPFPYYDCRPLLEKTQVGGRPVKTVLFRTGRAWKDCSLSLCDHPEILDRMFRDQMTSSNSWTVLSPGSRFEIWIGDLAGSLERCLIAGRGLEPSDLSGQPLPRVFYPSEFITSSRDLSLELWLRWQTPVLLTCCTFASFTKADLKKGWLGAHKLDLLFEQCKLKFNVVAYVNSLGSALESVKAFGDLSAVPVVAIWGGGVCCMLSEKFAQQVRQSFYVTHGTGERVCNKKVSSFEPPTQESLLAAQRKKSRGRRQNTCSKKKIKKCQCSVCSGSSDYNLNMSESGPEKLITTSYTLRELLDMMGLWLREEGEKEKDSLLATPELLDRISELSVASMDIESRTQSLQAQKPGPGDGVKYADIDTAALENHSQCVQIPVMMAHMDGLSQTSSDEALSREGIFHVTDDSEAAVRLMMKQYLEWILKRQVACAREKMNLLRPYFELLERYRQRYFDFCQQWKEQDEANFQKEENDLRQRYSQRADDDDDAAARQENKDEEDQLAWSWDKFVSGQEAAGGSRASRDPSKEEEESEDADEDYDNSAFLYRTTLQSLLRSRPFCLLNPVQQQELKKSLGSDRAEPATSGGVTDALTRKKHRDFYQLAVRAWFHTIPGMLEKALHRAVDDYIIFSFYG